MLLESAQEYKLDVRTQKRRQRSQAHPCHAGPPASPSGSARSNHGVTKLKREPKHERCFWGKKNKPDATHEHTANACQKQNAASYSVPALEKQQETRHKSTDPAGQNSNSHDMT